MKTEIEKFQSGFSGMPGVSQNHHGSPQRRLEPIVLLDEPLGVLYRGTGKSRVGSWMGCMVHGRWCMLGCREFPSVDSRLFTGKLKSVAINFKMIKRGELCAERLTQPNSYRPLSATARHDTTQHNPQHPTPPLRVHTHKPLPTS